MPTGALAGIAGTTCVRLPDMAFRVYSVETDSYNSTSLVRSGRRYVTKRAAFSLMNRKAKAYVTEERGGKEFAIGWKGMFVDTKKHHERRDTTGQTLVRV